MFWSRRSKRNSLGRTWSEPRCFGRAGRNVSRLVELSRNIIVLVAPVETLSRLVEPGQNIEACGLADRNLSRLVELV